MKLMLSLLCDQLTATVCFGKAQENNLLLFDKRIITQYWLTLV